ncbi:MAG: V-type ATPase 116kDa subunit family protein [Nitrososphaera sp.]|jgi:V/A-type H+-transporting ATPase subunit I
MVLARLKKAAIILPRVEAQEAVSKIAELEWFHPLQTTSDHPNPYFDDLLLKAQRLYQDIDEVIRALSIPLETGVMATMFKGAPTGKTSYEISDIQDFIAKLEDNAASLLAKPKELLSERSSVTKQLEENKNVEAALGMAASLNIDLGSLRKLKHFYAEIFVIDSKDEAEIRRSLEGIQLVVTRLNDTKSALVAVGSRDDSERIIKVLRSFDTQPLQIPSSMSQNPKTAYNQAHAKVKELEARSLVLSKSISKLNVELLPKLLSLHEAARAAKDVLEVTRKPGGTENFAVIQGYIPDTMEKRFKDLTKDYVSVIEDVKFDRFADPSKTLPTLLTNKKYTRTFEVVTQTQGTPRYDEVDPTPIIAFVWPLFYGLMFADLGHGLLLFGLGMLLRVRGNGSIRTWGTLIAASGAAASIAGLATGDFFGFHISELQVIGPLVGPLGSIVGILNVSDLTFPEVIKILKVSVAIGIVHLLMAYFLRLARSLKENDKLRAYTHDIPSIIQFGAVLALILAAIGSGYDIIGMFGIGGKHHTETIPWLTYAFGKWVTVEVVAKAAPPIIIATVAVMIYGGKKEEDIAEAHGHGEGGGLMGLIIEVILVRIIEVLSNIISYTRLGIMLLVHVALLVTVNKSYENTHNLAILIGGNIGIMMIEGLIVYIQTIRLHLYEWFPKWYSGEGVEFKKILPKMLYTNIIWKDPHLTAEERRTEKRPMAAESAAKKAK